MNIYALIIWAAIMLAAFIVAWRAGYIAKFTTYIQATREELKKCTWPTWDELWNSTVVVTISIALLGGFTVFADFVFFKLIRAII